MRMEFLGESSGRFILSTSFRVCSTVEGETLPLRWDKYYKNIISCCKSGINSILLIQDRSTLSITPLSLFIHEDVFLRDLQFSQCNQLPVLVLVAGADTNITIDISQMLLLWFAAFLPCDWWIINLTPPCGKIKACTMAGRLYVWKKPRTVKIHFLASKSNSE